MRGYLGGVFVLLLVISSCEKTDIRIGKEGTYTVNVKVQKRGLVLNSSTKADRQVHGIYVAGDSASCGVKSEFDDWNFDYTVDAEILKIDGIFYFHLLSNNVLTHLDTIPLMSGTDDFYFSSEFGNQHNNGFHFFELSFEQNNSRTKTGKWLKGYNCSYGSLGTTQNQIIEEAEIVLFKKG